MSSSENGDIDYHHLGCFQSSNHPHHNPQQSNSGSSTVRRRSSYGQSHFSQQLSAQPIMFKDTCSMVGSQDNLGCSSPSRYDCYVTGGSRPQSRYEETITCCIPPPSPAPNNDRFVMGMIPGPQHRLMVQQQQQQQRTMSPNSRYRSSMSDRYREMSPSPGHFLANSTPMASNDNYTTYLSSTVHTPVKRYIPTPPLTCTNDQQTSAQSQYNDAPTLNNSGYHLSLPSQNALSQIGSSQTLKPPKSRINQQQNSQYRINMKCCSETQKPQINASALPSDHYATTPRIRSGNVGVKQNSTNVSNSSTANTICCQTQTGNQCEYANRVPSVEYIGSISGSSRVVTPISMMNQQDQSCLNCRRTTGVHQTTQTTGPIRYFFFYMESYRIVFITF